MGDKKIILKVIIKTTRQSIDEYEKEGLNDIVFNFHEGNTNFQNDWAIGKIIREITTSLLEKGELPF